MRISYEKSIGLDEQKIHETAASLKGYCEQLQEYVQEGGYEADEASINLLDDAAMFHKVSDLAEKLRGTTEKNRLKYIVVVGIGGSNLGAYAISEALHGGVVDAFDKNRMPKLLFADTTSVSLLNRIAAILEREVASADEICINIVSKSGSTTETIVNFEVLYSRLKEKFSDIDKQIVVTTDEGSPLWKKAQENDFSILTMPKKVGGRYSVFSASGLLPLALAGVDIKELVKGARDMRTQCLESDIQKNPALQSAVTTYLHSQNNIRIHNTFFFNPELEMLGKWYRQLMGESIGKEKDIHGNVVHAGIVPIVSIGTTDLHSMAQLYFGGPRVMTTQFVWTAQEKSMHVPQDMTFPLVDGIAGKTVSGIMSAILKGVQITYEKNHLPYMNIELADISERSLGQYMQFRMMEMMYLAKLMEVNAFDQPNVEEYKIETRSVLSEVQ